MVFGWFKRRGRRLPRRLPQRQLAPIADIVEQGLLVADVAVRMSVKNAIIMNALKRKVDYDEQEIVDMVRDSITELARERERDAQHIDQMRKEIRRTGRSSWSDSEYGDGDNRTLRHRQEVYEGVAVELRARATDPEYLRVTTARAREAAWHEIGNSLKERATHPYYSGGASEEYQAARDERIELLISRDLTELMQQHGSAPDKGKKRRLGKKAGAS
ncbi:asparagine synthase [Leucobacter sp. W1153]|uniref:asparagine synthase n=1 Tax=Leucobacter sp. W1153 TaxID=3439064 RepID=UPI003F4F5F27